MPVPVVDQTTDLVIIDDVAAHLNWSAAQQTKYSVEMGWFISSVTPVVERIVGPVMSRVVDEWYDGGSDTILLNSPPVLSMVTVTETTGMTVRALTEQPLDGTPATAYGFTLDKSQGVMIRRSSGSVSQFAAGSRNIHVVYNAGRALTVGNVPPNIRLAALELIRVNWQPQQGGNRPQMGQTDLPVTDAAHLGFFVPNRVMELLLPGIHQIGFA